MIKFAIEIPPDLVTRLHEFSEKVVRKVARPAIRQATKEFLPRGRQLAEFRVGGKMGRLLARYMTVRSHVTKNRKNIVARMEISRRGDQIFVDISRKLRRNYIPAAIEYGHVIARRGREFTGGMTVREYKTERRALVSAGRFVAPIPFMRPAFQMGRGPAAAELIALLRKGIEAEAARSAKGAAAS